MPNLCYNQMAYVKYPVWRCLFVVCMLDGALMDDKKSLPPNSDTTEQAIPQKPPDRKSIE
jgi:hypothetical protein